MIVIDENLQDIKSSDNFIALGSFDGLHLGHRSLIYKVVEEAKKNNGKSIVYTFKNHPRTLLNKDNAPKLIMSNDDKVKMLSDLDVDMICFQKFDEEFMKMTPTEFVEFLVKKFNAKGIVVGFNYKFGYKNMGDINLLTELSKKYGYKLYVLEPYIYDEKVISSTRIREAINEGRLEEAQKMLGRCYSLKGIVVHGRQIGRTIGFPTANLEYDKNFILPKMGVYYTNIKVNNKLYKSITSIGYNPTVNGKKLTVETYILDFNENIYGKKIEVRFIKKIRDNVKFNGINELKDQLEKDKKFARYENYIEA